jgi:hypothetical protein
VVLDAQDAQTRLYLAVITDQVRARSKGRTLSLNQIALMSDINPFNLPPDIELSVVDARRRCGWSLNSRWHSLVEVMAGLSAGTR